MSTAIDWMRDGLCSQTDPDAFHPEKGGAVEPAKAVCAACPVLTECRSWALATDQRFGVWGGLSARERQQIRTRTTTNSTRHDAHPAKNVRRVGAPNTQLSGENPMVGNGIRVGGRSA